tara:strand:- start:35979 stop:36761 length:783 start_codon:yes stop_codon:yes gene_type:complete
MAEMRLADLPYALKENVLEDSQDFVAFLGHCIAHGAKSKSQNFQDIWALYENSFETDLIYVEFGATDGITGSNTYLLQKDYHWRGLLAEPNPIWYEALYKNRTGEYGEPKIVEKAVWTDSGKDLTFLSPTESDLGTIQGYGENDEHAEKRDGSPTITVKSVGLAHMLMDKFSWYLENESYTLDISYMSVDTEGSEYDILKAYFENKYSKWFNINCITVEHNYNPDTRKNIRDLMEANGYVNKFPEISRWDDFWKKIEKVD